MVRELALGGEPRAEAFLTHIFSCILRAALAHSRAVSVAIALLVSPTALPESVRSNSAVIALTLVAFTFLLEGVLAADALGVRKPNVASAVPMSDRVPLRAEASVSLSSASSPQGDSVTWHTAPTRGGVPIAGSGAGAALIFIPPTTIDGVHVPGAYVTHTALRARLARESMSMPFVDALGACNQRLRAHIGACFAVSASDSSAPLNRLLAAVGVAFASLAQLGAWVISIMRTRVDAADAAAIVGGLVSPFAAAAALRLGSLTAAAPLVALLAVPAVAFVNESSVSDCAKWAHEPRRAARAAPRVAAALMRLALWCLVAPSLVASALLYAPAHAVVWVPTLAAAAAAVGTERNASAWAAPKDSGDSWSHTLSAAAITPTLGEWPSEALASNYALLTTWPQAAPWAVAVSLLVGRTTGVLVLVALLPSLLVPFLAACFAQAAQGDGLSVATIVSALSRFARLVGCQCVGRRASRSAALTRPAGWQRPGTAQTSASTTVASGVGVIASTDTASAAGLGAGTGAAVLAPRLSSSPYLFRLPRSVRASLRWIAHALTATALALALGQPTEGGSPTWLSSPVSFAAGAPRAVADLAAAAAGLVPSERAVASVKSAAALASALAAVAAASPPINDSIFAGAASAAASVVAVTAAAAAVLSWLWRCSGSGSRSGSGSASGGSSGGFTGSGNIRAGGADFCAVSFRETARHLPSGLALALSLAVQPLPNSAMMITSPALTASLAAAFAFATLVSTFALVTCDGAAVSEALFHCAARDAAAAGFDVAAVARAVAGMDAAPLPSAPLAGVGAIVPAVPPQLTSAQLKRFSVIAAGLARLRLRCAFHGAAVALSIETFTEARMRVSGTFGIVSIDAPLAIHAERKELLLLSPRLSLPEGSGEPPPSPSPVLSTMSAHIRGTDVYAPALGSFRVLRQTLTPAALIRASAPRDSSFDARGGGGGVPQVAPRTFARARPSMHAERVGVSRPPRRIRPVQWTRNPVAMVRLTSSQAL